MGRYILVGFCTGVGHMGRYILVGFCTGVGHMGIDIFWSVAVYILLSQVSVYHEFST